MKIYNTFKKNSCKWNHRSRVSIENKDEMATRGGDIDNDQYMW